MRSLTLRNPDLTAWVCFLLLLTPLLFARPVAAGQSELDEYVAFRGTVDAFYADFEAIPPDDLINDLTALTEAFLASLEAINPDECFALRYVAEHVAARTLLDGLQAPPDYDAVGAASLTLWWTLHTYATTIEVCC